MKDRTVIVLAAALAIVQVACDIRDDPVEELRDEQADVARERSEIRQEMIEEHREFHERMQKLPPEERRRLHERMRREMGPVEGDGTQTRPGAGMPAPGAGARGRSGPPTATPDTAAPGGAGAVQR